MVTYSWSKTMHLRLKQHDANAKVIAAYLEEEALVTDVLYTGKVACYHSACKSLSGLTHSFVI